MSEETAIPQEVADLVELARTSVTKVIGVEPDLTPETLPLVDEYFRQATSEASDEVRQLVTAAVGCYFGEVVRRKLHGRWTIRGADPATWRVELITCYLYLHPVGMAGEVMVGAQTDDHDGSFATLAELNDELAEMLGKAAPLSEEEYYSLSARVEILQLAADWLVGRQLNSAHDHDHDHEQRRYSAADYSARLDLDTI
jgi:hypothetical protein